MARTKVIRRRECIASEPCEVETPHGTFKGKRCPDGQEVNTNKPLYEAEKVVELGAFKPSLHEYIGEIQDAISMSGCPTQGYGGFVKFVFNAKDVDTKPMCYYVYLEHDNQTADRGLEREAKELSNDKPMGVNRIRGKYGVNLSMYQRECEQVAYEEIPLTKLKRLEYWIPWKVGVHSYDHACEGRFPNTANVVGRGQGVKILQEQIAQTKILAEKVGKPFELKSCFNSLRSGWRRSIELNAENLEKLKQGVLPEDQPRDQVKEVCYC